MPRTCSQQQEKPPKWEAPTLQQRVVPARHTCRKSTQSTKDSVQSKIINKRDQLFFFQEEGGIGTSLFFFLKKYLFIYLFIYCWLCWVFVPFRVLSLVVASEGYSLVRMQASHCGGFSCCGAHVLGQAGSVGVACGFSCPVACRIFLEQGLNL